MKYSQKLCIEAFELIIETGMSNTNLCDCLEISTATFYAWTNKDCKGYKPEFTEHILLARQESKKYRRQEALDALRKSAMGYDYEESTVEYIDGKEVKKIVRKKHQPANIQAVTALLENSSRLIDIDFFQN